MFRSILSTSALIYLMAFLPTYVFAKTGATGNFKVAAQGSAQCSFSLFTTDKLDNYAQLAKLCKKVSIDLLPCDNQNNAYTTIAATDTQGGQSTLLADIRNYQPTDCGLAESALGGFCSEAKRVADRTCNSSIAQGSTVNNAIDGSPASARETSSVSDNQKTQNDIPTSTDALNQGGANEKLGANPLVGATGDRHNKTFTGKDINDPSKNTTYEKRGKDYYKVGPNGESTRLSKEEVQKLKEQQIEEQAFAKQTQDAKKLENAYKNYQNCIQSANSGAASENCEQLLTSACEDIKKTGALPSDKAHLCGEQAQRSARAKAAARQDFQELRLRINRIRAPAAAAAANTQNPERCASVPGQISKMTAQLSKLESSHRVCSSNSNTAAFMCPLTVSPTAILVSTVMNMAKGLIDGKGAAENCHWTSAANNAAQSLMAAGAAVCGGAQMLCKNKCQATTKSLDQLKKDLDNIVAACSATRTAANDVNRKIVDIQTVNNDKFARCEEHKIDIGQMTALVGNFGVAFAQAKQCSAALSTSTGTGQISQQTICADPANANLLTCRCLTNPTGEGCPGVSSATGAGFSKMANTNGVSQMPSIGGGATFDSSNLGSMSGDEYGDDTPSYFGSGKDSNSLPSFGSAASSGGFGGGGGAGPRGGAGTDTPKGTGGELPSAKGASGSYKTGGFGNSKSNFANKNNLKNSKKFNDAVNTLERKIAAEQYQQQVSSSTGISNWDKIKTRYLEKKSTLIGQ